MTRWAALPVRWRLTAAFAAAMALLISGLSGFVYARTGADLLAAVDAGLSSRAELLATNVQKHGPGLTGARPTLIESDEVFAQIATAAGRITQSSPLIAGQRLLSPGQIRQVRRPLWTERRIPGIGASCRTAPAASTHAPAASPSQTEVSTRSRSGRSSSRPW